MCGIYCSLCFAHDESTCGNCQIDGLTHKLLENRGPNNDAQYTVSTDDYHLYFAGYVLWQQGSELCKQPHIYKQHVLLLNGDIFSKRDNLVQSDTDWLIKEIDKCQTLAELVEFFKHCKGPYSLIYYNRQSEKLYFIRDSLGRQSLLISLDNEHRLCFSSVLGKFQAPIIEGHKFNFLFRNFVPEMLLYLGRTRRTSKACIELPPLGLFHIDLKTKSFFLNPWQSFNSNESYKEQLNELETLFNKKIGLLDNIDPYWLRTDAQESTDSFSFEEILKDMNDEMADKIYETALENSSVKYVCEHLLQLLKNSLDDRIKATPLACRHCLSSSIQQCDHAKIGILFSGGIDCTILARLSDLLISKHLPIDLINVSFEKIDRGKKKDVQQEIDYSTPDRISARDSLSELKQLCPNRKWNLIEVNVTRDELNKALQSHISHSVHPLCSVLDESLGSVLWFGARGCSYSENNVSAQTHHCRVLLIGSGADELFGGYTRHRNAFIRPHQTLSPYKNLDNELEFDFKRLPSRNLARDDRVIGDCGVTARSPFLEEAFVHFIRNLRAEQKCYHRLEQGVGDKLLLRLCGYKLGLRKVVSLKKRAMQFGSRIADRKQNAKDLAKSLIQFKDE